MSALQVVEEIDGSALDPLVARLDDILAELREAIDDHTEITDADRIDRISALERLRGVTAALQLSECVRFGQSQVAGQLAADVHPRAIGRGVADQIALACRISPFAGSRRLGVARALWFDLPHTYAGLAAGDLSEHRAEIVVTETRHLDGATRRAVDAEANAAGMATMGTRSAAACIRRHAYEADRQGYLDRGRTERRSRRVGLRPAPTRCRSSRDTFRSNRAWPATPHYAGRPTPPSATETRERGIRSWPTCSSSGSPVSPVRRTSASRCSC